MLFLMYAEELPWRDLMNMKFFAFNIWIFPSIDFDFADPATVEKIVLQ